MRCVENLFDQGNLNEFGLSSGHYQSRRILLLGLIKRAQEEKRLTETDFDLEEEQSSDSVISEGIGLTRIFISFKN